MKKLFINLLKFCFAGGLIYWLIKTEKITLEPFIKLWQVPWLIAVIFSLVFLQIFINNYRWLLLLQAQGIQSSIRQTLPLTFIGLFFNLAMPGSVGGDVMKAYYVAKEHSGTKLRAVTSILMDRMVGFYAMGLLGIISVILNFERILSSQQLKGLAFFILGIVVGFTIFFAIGMSRRVRGLNKFFIHKLPAKNMIEKLYDAIHAFHHGRSQFIAGIFLSMLCHTTIIFGFYILARELSFPDVTIEALFFIVPLGLIATAVPISPAGIGVGQAVFLTLFTWYFGTSTQVGPILITIFQVVQALWGIIGAMLYLMRKTPPAPKAVTV